MLFVFFFLQILETYNRPNAGIHFFLFNLLSENWVISHQTMLSTWVRWIWSFNQWLVVVDVWNHHVLSPHRMDQTVRFWWWITSGLTFGLKACRAFWLIILTFVYIFIFIFFRLEWSQCFVFVVIPGLIHDHKFWTHHWPWTSSASE